LLSQFQDLHVVLQVFYPDEDSEAAATCEAWHGDVTGILSHDQAGDGEEVVQADPYGCGGLWERFLVGWQPRPQVCAHLFIGVACTSVTHPYVDPMPAQARQVQGANMTHEP